MNCDELIAKLKSQKAAILRIQAETIRRSYQGQFDEGDSAYAKYCQAKIRYEKALRTYNSLLKGS